MDQPLKNLGFVAQIGFEQPGTDLDTLPKTNTSPPKQMVLRRLIVGIYDVAFFQGATYWF